MGRKLWNEHLFTFQGEDYWFTVDFALDMQVGKDLDSELDVTYNNTRAAIFQGGLGKNFNFYSVVYENQGRFADYFNRYAESIKPGTKERLLFPDVESPNLLWGRLMIILLPRLIFPIAPANFLICSLAMARILLEMDIGHCC